MRKCNTPVEFVRVALAAVHIIYISVLVVNIYIRYLFVFVVGVGRYITTACAFFLMGRVLRLSRRVYLFGGV